MLCTKLPMPSSLPDRFTGCLLGLALADAIGSPFEGIPPEDIRHRFGSNNRLLSSLPEELTYTDDTEMTLNLAEHLLTHPTVDPDALILHFAANYSDSRGYGPGTRRLISAIQSGSDWRSLTESIFPGGSFGNGAAMRVAPIGLRYHSDLSAVSDEATRSSIVTHSHPLAVDAARLVALAIALLLQGTPPQQLCSQLATHAATDEFEWQMRTLSHLSPTDALPDFGNTLAAHRSVGTAIGCFVINPSSYLDVVTRAISLGGDTDTIAAIAGSLAGTHLGLTALPPDLLLRLENTSRGRDYISTLAARLFSLST